MAATAAAPYGVSGSSLDPSGGGEKESLAVATYDDSEGEVQIMDIDAPLHDLVAPTSAPREWVSATLPALQAELAKPGLPWVLVAFEFTGALSTQLVASGRYRVLTCDRRVSQGCCDAYRGDVEDVVDLIHWEAIFCVGPDCYQHHCRDDYLAAKIGDGRAFWAGAKVLWCICLPRATMVLVEQPDTLVHTMLDYAQLPGVAVHHLRSSLFGDAPDKYLRLTTVNMELDLPAVGQAVPRVSEARSQYDFADPDERDRSRSSWLPFRGVCAALSRATARVRPAPERATYATAVELFAAAWHAKGHPVPRDYQNSDARPTGAERREYQKIRGQGDGRLVDAVVPREAAAAPSLAARRARSDELVQGPPGSGKAMIARATAARRAWPDGLVVPVDREAVTRRHLDRVARRGEGLTETQLRAQRALPPAGGLPSAKTANLLLVGRSAQLGCPAALLLRMADGTERCMVPGGVIEAGESPQLAAFREFVEEVFGMGGDAACSAARRLSDRCEAEGTVTGPYGRPPLVHPSYLVRAGVGHYAIDAVARRFKANNEAEGVLLVPLAGIDGGALEVKDAEGESLKLRNKLGVARITAAQALWARAPDRPLARSGGGRPSGGSGGGGGGAGGGSRDDGGRGGGRGGAGRGASIGSPRLPPSSGERHMASGAELALAWDQPLLKTLSPNATGLAEQSEEDATPRPPTEVGGVDVSGTPLRPERPAALTGNSVVLLLVYLLGMVPLVLTFAGGTHVPAATRPTLAGGAVEAAETWATTLVAAPRKLVGYAVGKAASGAKVVAVPVATVSPENIAARRQGASRGGLQLVWCTLALLSGTGPAYSIAALAAARSASFSMFGENTQPLVRADAALQVATGILAGSSEELIAPIPTKWMVLDAPTPRELVPRMAEDIEAFKLDLGQYRGPHEEHVRGWVDSVQPLDLSEVPDEMLDQPVPIRDPALALELYPRPLAIHELPWLPRMPQPAVPMPADCEGFRARSAPDLLSLTAQRQVDEWMEAVRRDLQCIEDHGPKCDRRDRPATLVIGQEEYAPCARGRVWDCRHLVSDLCVPLDYRAPLATDFDLPYLKEAFEGYPDQRLASYVLEGVRLEADMELHMVLQPPLQSLPEGIVSVQKTIRELRDRGFYFFTDELPFSPITVMSQGSAIKKNGKYRRTSDMGSPRRELRDSAGRRARSINDASRSYGVPEWIHRSVDPAVCEWSRARYSHVPTWLRQADTQGVDAMPIYGKGSPQLSYKFPKEEKPTLEMVMKTIAIMAHAAYLQGEALYVWVNDAAFYFNQFAYSSEEYFKSNLVVLAQEGDTLANGQSVAAGTIILVSEQRLGFGAFAASNLCQRFSNFYRDRILREFDRLEEEEFARAPSVAWAAWRESRRPLEDECRLRYKKRPGQAAVDCTQTRLGTQEQYQDDPIYICVGRSRALRLIVAAETVTVGIKLVMADADKRQMGVGVLWIGIVVIAGLGLVAVPRSKLLTAKDYLQRAAQGKLPFREYRAMLGLLEHLRFIARLTSSANGALYAPHGAYGRAEIDTATLVVPSALMIEKLQAWLAIVMHCAGAAVTVAFMVTTEFARQMAHRIMVATADAAGDGAGTPGIGGYMHGLFWRVAIPAHHVGLMHITAWEVLATAINLLLFGGYADQDTLLAFKSDALLTAYVLRKEGSSSRVVEFIVHLLLRSPQYQRAKRYLTIQHLAGDGNPHADLVSRGLWADFYALCAHMGVRATEVALTPEAEEFLGAVLHFAQEGGVGGGSAPLLQEFLAAGGGAAQEALSDVTLGEDVGSMADLNEFEPHRIEGADLFNDQEVIKRRYAVGAGTGVVRDVFRAWHRAAVIIQASWRRRAEARAVWRVRHQWRAYDSAKFRRLMPRHWRWWCLTGRHLPGYGDARVVLHLCAAVVLQRRWRFRYHLRRLRAAHRIQGQWRWREHLRQLRAWWVWVHQMQALAARNRDDLLTHEVSGVPLRVRGSGPSSPPTSLAGSDHGVAASPASTVDNHPASESSDSTLGGYTRARRDIARVDAALAGQRPVASTVARFEHSIIGVHDRDAEGNVWNERRELHLCDFHRVELEVEPRLNPDTVGARLAAERRREDLEVNAPSRANSQGSERSLGLRSERSRQWYHGPRGPRRDPLGISYNAYMRRVDIIFDEHISRGWSILTGASLIETSLRSWNRQRESEHYVPVVERGFPRLRLRALPFIAPYDGAIWRHRAAHNLPQHAMHHIAVGPRPPSPVARAAPRREGSSDSFNNQEVIENMPTSKFRPPAVLMAESPEARPALRKSWSVAPRHATSLAAVVARGKKATRKSTPSPPAVSQVLRPAGHVYATPAFGTSRLGEEERDRVELFIDRLKSDRSAGRIDAPAEDLREMAMGVAEARRDGTNPRTTSKNDLAWQEFKAYAAMRGFDPNLRTSWTRAFPERENLKLASWLLHCAQQMRPRSSSDAVAKPMSVYGGRYLALRRVFRLRSQELPPSSEVRETLRGLIRRYIRRFGIEDLRPKRVEPITPRIVRKVVHLAQRGTARLGSLTFSLANWVCFNVVAWMVINLSVGSRKGESTKLPGDTDGNDWFTRSSVSLGLGPRIVTDPTEEQWRSMKEGDTVRLAPKGAKADPYGTCHGTEPIVLPYHNDELNAAKWIRDIELRWPCHGADRKARPLFCDESGAVFTDSRFGGLIKMALVLVLGTATAKAYSPHSWRVWLATAARVNGASDAMIQALGRWLNPDSVKLYARLTAGEYAMWIDKIMSVDHVDATRTTNFPVMDVEDILRPWEEALREPTTGKRKRSGEDAFDAAAATVAGAVAPALSRGTRIQVYWTEEQQWYTATATRWQWEEGDDGQRQRATHLVYDAVGAWPETKLWHCLDDVTWRTIGADE